MDKYKDIDTFLDFTELNKKWKKEKQKQIRLNKVLTCLGLVLCVVGYILIEVCL